MDFKSSLYAGNSDVNVVALIQYTVNEDDDRDNVNDVISC
jgi:hypothetical protein